MRLMQGAPARRRAPPVAGHPGRGRELDLQGGRPAVDAYARRGGVVGGRGGAARRAARGGPL
eukprot:2816685-Lingulodinium_polyedra.AAC.1